MIRQMKPLPPDIQLGVTLAQRVKQIRDFRNLTLKDVAQGSRFPATRIEDIESGLETWLSASERQVLSKALGIEPALLEEVEVRSKMHDAKALEIASYDLSQYILRGDRNLKCPVCGSILKCSVQDAFDLEGMPIKLPKAFCAQCPFVL